MGVGVGDGAVLGAALLLTDAGEVVGEGAALLDA